MNSFLPARYRVIGNPLFTERRVELVAAILALILALQLIYSVFSLLTLSAPEPIVPAAESLAFSEVRAVRSISEQQSNEIVARPLFWPSRRALGSSPIEQDVPDDGSPTGELASVSLTGVFGGGKSAGIIAVAEDKKYRVLTGEKLFGWKLDSMDLDHAVFSRRGKIQKLMLKSAGKKSSKNVVKTKKRVNKMRKRKL